MLFPTYAPSWHGLGNAYRALRRDSDAIEAYQKAISLDPNQAWSYHNLGQIFTQQDDFPRAIKQYQQAIDRHGADRARAASWVGLGDAYSAAERHRDAIEAYQQTLKLDPDQAYAWNGLGMALAAIQLANRFERSGSPSASGHTFGLYRLEILAAAGYDGFVSIELEDANFNGTEEGEKQGLLLARRFLEGC